MTRRNWQRSRDGEIPFSTQGGFLGIEEFLENPKGSANGGLTPGIWGLDRGKRGAQYFDHRGKFGIS